MYLHKVRAAIIICDISYCIVLIIQISNTYKVLHGRKEDEK